MRQLARVLLLFGLNFKTDSSRTECDFLVYMESTPPLMKNNKELGSVLLK